MRNILCLLLLSLTAGAFAQPTYSWLASHDSSESLQNRIPPPTGFERVAVEKNSFGEWLRNIPLMEGKPDVMLFDGRKKGNQSAHQAVVNIDIGSKDLQQCADAVMRLYAEYQYSLKAYDNIHFNYTSGDKVDFVRWASGQRPVVRGNSVRWQSSSSRGYGYSNFRSYLISIFNYAGTYSLDRELKKVDQVQQIRPGDVFIKGGFPGHAVIVMDVAVYPATGEKAFLIAQSYMPAQNIHLLKNPTDPELSPWYIAKEGDLLSPEWRFAEGSLKRFE